MLSGNSPLANPTKSLKVWLYRQADFIRACQLIDETDWNQVLTGNSVDAAAESWTNEFLNIMEQCVPSRILPAKRNIPWLSPNIVHHIKRRNSIFQKAKKTNKVSHIAKYKFM